MVNTMSSHISNLHDVKSFVYSINYFENNEKMAALSNFTLSKGLRDFFFSEYRFHHIVPAMYISFLFKFIFNFVHILILI
jgi:hypothetical protein